MSLTLVTGGTGWLGARLVDVLLRGLPDDPRFATPTSRKLRVLASPDAAVPKAFSNVPDLAIVRGDLRTGSGLDELTKDARGATLFHVAGVIHPQGGIPELYAVNVEGTRRLLDAAAAAGVRRVVVVSSNSPLGCNPSPEHTFDEKSPFNPYMNYGRSKMLMEELVAEYQRGGRLETVIIRPPWFYGVNQPARQTLFFQMIRTGKAPIVGSGNNRRSMAYVDNICQGLLLCEQTAAANGQTYWIADRRPYTMNEIIDTVERLLEREFNFKVAHKRMRLPGLAGDVATVVDAAIQRTGRYHQKIHVLSEMNKTIACRVDKAVAELGYDPKIDLEEGMRRSIRWCLDNGHTL
jgi:nucleoside-diphosphate-sugar epimerase